MLFSGGDSCFTPPATLQFPYRVDMFRTPSPAYAHGILRDNTHIGGLSAATSDGLQDQISRTP